MSKTKRSTAITGDNALIETPRTQADRLYRAVTECVRQRKRYAKLVEAGVTEEEQQGALKIACICDEVLTQSAAAYETIAADAAIHRSEEWWHKANALWQASREYDRRHRDCDQHSKTFATHSRKELVELAMEYDLEASALLALQQAATAFRKTVPDADLEPSPARVA
jgi:hypothetical protein